MRKIITILTILLIPIASCGQTEKNVENYAQLPKNEAQAVVLDLSYVFTDTQIDGLSQKIISYEKATTNEIAILTVDSILPYTNLGTYATELSNYWGVGTKEKDNGLIIVLLATKRQVWISTGNGTQKILTDAVCQQIVNEAMIPYFKNGDYYKGLDAALDAIIAKWK